MKMIPQSTTSPWLKWSPLSKWGFIILFLIWVFGVIGIFYVVQKPFTMAGLQSLMQERTPFTFSLAALGQTLLDVLAGLWLWLMNLGLGLWLYGRLKLAGEVRDEAGPWEALAFGSGLGIGAVGIIVLVLGLVGLISPLIFYSLATILTVVTLPQIVQTIKPLRLPALPFLPKVYLFLTLAFALTIALLPPTDWDGLFYHLTGPKLYLTAGQIRPGIDIPHLNFPSLFEMHFMLALAIRGAATAKLLHFGFSLLLIILVYLLAKRQLGLKDEWWAVLFLLSMPMVLTLAGWAYNDLALAFYQVGALYALLEYQRRHSQPATSNDQPNDHPPEARGQIPWLILSSLFCGLAMSLKYTSFVAPVTLMGLLLWWQWRARCSLIDTLKAALALTLPALIIASPWYIKNWAFTGNPVYPFLFEGRFWDEFRTAAYSTAGSGLGFDLWAWITLPYQLPLGIKDANYLDGRTGPLFLAFLPWLLLYGFFPSRRSVPSTSLRTSPLALKALLIFALTQYLFWMLGVIWSQGLWQSRLLLSALVALSPVLASILYDLRYLNHPQFSLQRFLKLLVSLVLLLGLVDQVMSDQNRAGWLFFRPLSYLTGSETQADYLLRRLGVHYAAMEAINTQFEAEATVAFLWEPRSFYCDRDCRPDSILDEFGHLQYQHGADATAIAQAWRARGITHVLVHRLGYNFLLADENVAPEIRPNPALLNALEADHFELVFDLRGAYQGYRLK